MPYIALCTMYLHSWQQISSVQTLANNVLSVVMTAVIYYENNFGNGGQVLKFCTVEHLILTNLSTKGLKVRICNRSVVDVELEAWHYFVGYSRLPVRSVGDNNCCNNKKCTM